MNGDEAVHCLCGHVHERHEAPCKTCECDMTADLRQVAKVLRDVYLDAARQTRDGRAVDLFDVSELPAPPAAPSD